MYKSSPDDAPLQGAGQGNGAGPSMWTLVSTTVMISAMKRAGHGVQLLSSHFPFQSCLGMDSVFCNMYDTDTVQTAQTIEQTGKDVIQQLQHEVD
jgi:hypothetical protein